MIKNEKAEVREVFGIRRELGEVVEILFNVNLNLKKIKPSLKHKNLQFIEDFHLRLETVQAEISTLSTIIEKDCLSERSIFFDTKLIDEVIEEEDNRLNLPSNLRERNKKIIDEQVIRTE